MPVAYARTVVPSEALAVPTPPFLGTVGDATRPVGEWSKLHGVPVSTIRSRLDKGWPPAQAVQTPSDRRFRPAVRNRVADPARACPRLRRHRASGQAFVEWVEQGERNTRYFGPWDSAEAAAAYNRFQVEWAGRGRGRPPLRPGGMVTVAVLVAGWLDHCDGYYVKNGRPTSEVYGQRSAAAAVVRAFPDLPAADFGPGQLRAVRDAIVAAGKSRSTANAYQTRVVQMFGWAVGQRLVAADVWHSLQKVERLQRGRTKAPDRAKRRPVKWDDVRRTLRHLHPTAARRLVLMRLTLAHWWIGCRPQDVAGMKPGEVDRSGPLWRWEPATHKNEHRGQDLVYWIGPKAQRVLRPLLDGCPTDGFVFRYPPRGSGRGAGQSIRITRHEYGRRVADACEVGRVEPWTPHQLRHAKATDTARRYGSMEAAAAALGDTVETVSKVYVHVDPLDAVRQKIARETG